VQLANGDATKITVAMQPADHTIAAENIVLQVRAIHAPGGLVPLVNDVSAYQLDLLSSLRATLPYALLVIVVAVSALLFLTTGSVLMPIKAIVLNILSLTATFGALVWIFQDGHLQNLLGFQSTGSIDATGDNREAVSSGMQRTGWLITSAAPAPLYAIWQKIGLGESASYTRNNETVVLEEIEREKAQV
jgi:trehalose monomycolate/heme transporter